jgi:hypothetical protein
MRAGAWSGATKAGSMACMNPYPYRLIGILLVAGGAVGLLHGGFSYTKETRRANLGPLVLQVQEKETVVAPVALSAASLALGVFLLAGMRNKG